MENAKFTKLDIEKKQDHYYLVPDDNCFYFIEYTKGKPFSFSSANSFIHNLKKSPLTRGTFQWKHKLRAINVAAAVLLRELPKDWLSNSTFIPIPPSKTRDHLEYDDRMVRILKKIDVDVREIVCQTHSMNAAHTSEDRHSVDDLVENYEIDEEQVEPIPEHIVIVDDMVTAGAHFRAMRRVLGHRFPETPVSGVFSGEEGIPTR